MPQRTDVFDLARLGLTSGEGRRLDLHVARRAVRVRRPALRGQPDVGAGAARRLAHHGRGWALRLRFDRRRSQGPCVRCLEPAAPHFAVDAREVHQPGAGDEELSSPYVDDDGELDLAAWARDALALSLPAQITCRPECAGLCAQCGANLNDEPGPRARDRPGPALGEALRAQVRLGPGGDCATLFRRPWPSPSRSSRTPARTSAARRTRSRRLRSTVPAVPLAAPPAPGVPAPAAPTPGARSCTCTTTITTTSTMCRARPWPPTNR